MKRLLGVFAALLLMGCAPRIVKAQVTYTLPQTVDVTLASGLNCTGTQQIFTTGTTPNFTNLGQTQHFITVSGSITTSFYAAILGVDAAGNQTTISDSLTFTNTVQAGPQSISGTTSGSGRYANIRVIVQCTPITAVFTLTYSGTSATPIVSSGGNLLAQVDKFVGNGPVSTGPFNQTFLQTPFGNSLGTMVFNFTGTSGITDSLTVQCRNAAQNSVYNGFTIPLSSQTNQVLIPLPPSVCPLVTITYFQSSGGTGNVAVDYIFNLPGGQTGVTGASLTDPLNAGAIEEKGPRWDALSGAVVGSQATASRAASTTKRHVADCVTVSAGAAAAPVATILTVNLRDGASGAGTIIWTTTIAASATTGQHGAVAFCGLNLIGSFNTAMTLEFSAPLANEQESVALTGYDVQ
jgi:hypothetical protein